MSVAITVAFVLSGSLQVALSIGMVEPIVQTGFYHLHERIWKHIREHPSTLLHHPTGFRPN